MLTRKSGLLPRVHSLIRSERFSSYYPLFQTPTKPGRTFREAEIEKYKKLQNQQESSESSSMIKSMTENDSYKNFFRDFSNSVMTRTKMTSFQEQQSFDRIFKYLINTKGDIGVTDALIEFSGLSESDDPRTNKMLQGAKARLGPTGKVVSSLEEIQSSFISKTNKNKAVLTALAPTLQYINNQINTSEELFEFTQNKVIEPFLKASSDIWNSNELTLSEAVLLKSISEDSAYDASKPKINLTTFPVLLKFCLNSLTYDFDSIDETFLMIEFIKNHKSIELFEFGLNIDVYNSLLAQVWDKTQNLQLIGKLLEDLELNAIQPDLLTYKVLSKIYLKCMGVKEEIRAEPYLLWGDSANIYKTKNFISSMEIPKSL